MGKKERVEYNKSSKKLKLDSKFSENKRMNSWGTSGAPALHEYKPFWLTVKASYAPRAVNIAKSVSVETDSQPGWKCPLSQQSYDILPQLQICLIASRIIHRLLQIMSVLEQYKTIGSCRCFVTLIVNQNNPWWKFRCLMASHIDIVVALKYCCLWFIGPSDHTSSSFWNQTCDSSQSTWAT